jgi:hypothetical protein
LLDLAHRLPRNVDPRRENALHDRAHHSLMAWVSLLVMAK